MCVPPLLTLHMLWQQNPLQCIMCSVCSRWVTRWWRPEVWLRWTGQQLILSLMVKFTCKFTAFSMSKPVGVTYVATREVILSSMYEGLDVTLHVSMACDGKPHNAGTSQASQLHTYVRTYVLSPYLPTYVRTNMCTICMHVDTCNSTFRSHCIIQVYVHCTCFLNKIR